MILYTKDRRSKALLCVVAIFLTSSAYADFNSYFSLDTLRAAKLAIQLGGFSAHQGKAQNIDIEGLIGDRFTVTQQNDQNVLVGLGLYIDGYRANRFNLMYGINAFYLAPTTVKGKVIQEQMFTNLRYHYDIKNYPIYFDVKALIPMDCNKYDVTLDLGIGPNIIQTSNLHESSLDGITLPDNAYSGNTTTAFTATVGVGVKFNNVYKNIPVECGYRFFYLGQGDFHKKTDQLLNNLKTGDGYANALLCSVTL